MNWVDMIIIIILAVSGLKGLSRGFIVSLFNLLSFFMAIYIAKLYYPAVVGYIYNNTLIDEKIQEFIYNRVLSVIGSSNTGDNTNFLIESFRLPESISKSLNEGLELQMGFDRAIDAAELFLAEKLTYLFITIISIITIFLLIRSILLILVNVLDLIAKLPVINFFNRAAGLAFGLIKGVLAVFIIFTILTPVISMYPKGFIAQGTLNSVLGNYFYTHNFIINYLNGLGLPIS